MTCMTWFMSGFSLKMSNNVWLYRKIPVSLPGDTTFSIKLIFGSAPIVPSYPLTHHDMDYATQPKDESGVDTVTVFRLNFKL